MQTVGQFISEICDKYRERKFFIDYKRQEYTYAQWEKDSESLAQDLKEKDLHPGDFVLLWFGNNYGYLAAYGGAARAEGVVAPLSSRLTNREAAGIFALVRPRIVLTDEQGWENIGPVIKNNSAEYVGIFKDGKWEWEVLFPNVTARRSDSKLAHLRFTSGSSGEPKAVMLTHKNMLYRVGKPAQYALDRDVFFLAIPFVFRPDRIIQTC